MQAHSGSHDSCHDYFLTLYNIEVNSCLAIQDSEGLFPCILGHEAAGYDESSLFRLAYIPDLYVDAFAFIASAIILISSKQG